MACCQRAEAQSRRANAAANGGRGGSAAPCKRRTEAGLGLPWDSEPDEDSPLPLSAREPLLLCAGLASACSSAARARQLRCSGRLRLPLPVSCCWAAVVGASEAAEAGAASAAAEASLAAVSAAAEGAAAATGALKGEGRSVQIAPGVAAGHTGTLTARTNCGSLSSFWSMPVWAAGTWMASGGRPRRRSMVQQR